MNDEKGITMTDKVYEYQAGVDDMSDTDRSCLHYHFVDARLEQRPNGRWRCLLAERWGDDKAGEYGRLEAIGRGDTPDRAISDARVTAKEMEMVPTLVAEAVSHIRDLLDEDLPGLDEQGGQ